MLMPAMPALPQSPVVVLAGGTGGAKFARGMLEVVGSDLVVIANTGDDIVIHDAHVSPDPDLICFHLADRIDERGWGLDGDTFEYMRSQDHWFNLGDEDREIGIRRRRLLESGGTLTEAIADLALDLRIAATVLPMSDAPVRTEIRSGGRWIGFQEFMVKERAAVPIEDVRFAGASQARPTTAVLAAIATARAIVIGPSNPVASIGPILAVCRDAIATAAAPVIAISPLVAGRVLKGPTREFMEWSGHEVTDDGVTAYYGNLIDSLITDDSPITAENRAGLAQATLDLAAAIT